MEEGKGEGAESTQLLPEEENEKISKKAKRDERFKNKVKIPLVATYPLIRFVDLPVLTSQDIIELVVETIERHNFNIEDSTKGIKEVFDKRYNPGWHCVIGESFGFDVSYDTSSLLYMFLNGTIGILLWKCD